MYIISTFYKFVTLNEQYGLYKQKFLNYMKQNNILGTIVLAREGINGSITSTEQNLKNFYSFLKKHPEFAELKFQEMATDFLPFSKAKVKLRKEIVTFGIDGLNPEKNTGIKLNACEWNKIIQDPEVFVVDNRNDYEIEFGSFENAINPETENFRDFPEYIAKHMPDKKRPVAMFCTGGIRCEKSSSYLKELGYETVYQLDGGIIKYLKDTNKEQSLWRGKCFVFDDRVAV